MAAIVAAPILGQGFTPGRQSTGGLELVLGPAETVELISRGRVAGPRFVGAWTVTPLRNGLHACPFGDPDGCEVFPLAVGEPLTLQSVDVCSTLPGFPLDVRVRELSQSLTVPDWLRLTAVELERESGCVSLLRRRALEAAVVAALGSPDAAAEVRLWGCRRGDPEPTVTPDGRSPRAVATVSLRLDSTATAGEVAAEARSKVGPADELEIVCRDRWGEPETGTMVDCARGCELEARRELLPGRGQWSCVCDPASGASVTCRWEAR